MTTNTGTEPRPHTESLVALGLTPLEAEVYAHLLVTSPSTGYAVAKGLSKPAANVYKAIETLQAKGAVLVDDGETRMCAAVPAAEFLQRLANAFNAHRQNAENILTRLPGPQSDARVYQMRSVAQVFDHARRMLRSARTIVLVDAFPQPLLELRPAIEAAAGRGVCVAVKVYAPADVAGAEVVLAPDGERIRRRWPGQWLNLVADGTEFMLSLLTGDGGQVVQAAWSESPYLAWIHHSQFACELGYTAVKAQLAAGADAKAIRETFERTETYFASDAVGYHRVRAQLEAVAPARPETGR